MVLGTLSSNQPSKDIWIVFIRLSANKS